MILVRSNLFFRILLWLFGPVFRLNKKAEESGGSIRFITENQLLYGYPVKKYKHRKGSRNTNK
ncbi:MAG: hypothetical protein ACI9YB_003060 [Halioglobus sp.]|jgi:hypothetical protein